MKKLSKKSAQSQLTSIYSAIRSNRSLFCTFGKDLCTRYAWSCSGFLTQNDIDSLRNAIINYVLTYRNAIPFKDIRKASFFLNYDFDA